MIKSLILERYGSSSNLQEKRINLKTDERMTKDRVSLVTNFITYEIVPLLLHDSTNNALSNDYNIKQGINIESVFYHQINDFTNDQCQLHI